MIELGSPSFGRFLVLLALQKNGFNGFGVVLLQPLSQCLLMGAILSFLELQGDFTREILSPPIYLFFWKKAWGDGLNRMWSLVIFKAGGGVEPYPRKPTCNL